LFVFVTKNYRVQIEVIFLALHSDSIVPALETSTAESPQLFFSFLQAALLLSNAKQLYNPNNLYPQKISTLRRAPMSRICIALSYLGTPL